MDSVRHVLRCGCYLGQMSPNINKLIGEQPPIGRDQIVVFDELCLELRQCLSRRSFIAIEGGDNDDVIAQAPPEIAIVGGFFVGLLRGNSRVEEKAICPLMDDANTRHPRFVERVNLGLGGIC